MKVAVVAHAGKTLGGGLPELRRVLAAEGVDRPFWCEVPEEPQGARPGSARAGRRAPSSSSPGAATAWCSAASTCSPGHRRRLAIVPAGTANLFASNLGIPKDIERGRRDRAARGRRATRRRPVQRRALRGHGGSRLRRRDDPRRRQRRAQGPASAALAYVWTGAENLRVEAFPREDRGRRGRLVRGQGELHPARQRRRALRRRRGVRGRPARRRRARARRRDRRGPRRVGPDAGADGRRHGEPVAVRAGRRKHARSRSS